MAQNLKKQTEEISKKYPSKRAAILPALWTAHDRDGWISPEAVSEIAAALGLTVSEVKETASFYSMFSLKPIGKNHIQLCRGLCCKLKDAEFIADYIRSKLGITEDGASADGKVHFSTVECLGSCGTAPVMQINNDYYENLTTEKVDEILKKLSTR
jgi:NADH-quinone oxidoreductase E subunit